MSIIRPVKATWAKAIDSDRLPIAASLLLHGSVLAMFIVSFEFSEPMREAPVSKVMEVSFAPGDGELADIPKLAAPEADESVTEEPAEQPEPQPESVDDIPVEDVVEPAPSEASDGATTDAEASLDAGSPNAGGMIWTPPAPTPNAADASMAYSEMDRERVVLPVVELGKGASSAVLLSYDQGRFSDAASISEAVRLTGGGRITMAASVDDKGKVTQCVVTTTSGSGLLDERACALISSYEYRPAQDARGVAHPSLVTEVLEWAKDGEFSVPGDADLALPAPPGQRIPTVSIPQTSSRRP